MLIFWDFFAEFDGILAWKYNASTNCFEPAAALKGHTYHVVSLVVGANKLYSCSMDKSIRDGSLAELVRKRFQSFDTELGAKIEAGKDDFELLEKKALEWGEPKVPSAKQQAYKQGK